MSWVNISKMDLPKKSEKKNSEKKDNTIDNLDTENQKNRELEKPVYLNRFEMVQEKYRLEILDGFHDLEEEVRKGIYGFVFSEYSHSRSSHFINMINKHIDYGYYKNHGFTDYERYAEDSLSGSDEERYWGEKHNKFAYV